jgi:hypothetical protein
MTISEHSNIDDLMAACLHFAEGDRCPSAISSSMVVISTCWNRDE